MEEQKQYGLKKSSIDLLSYLANKQFSMIGVNLKYEDLPEDGTIVFNGKKKKWWDCYKFETQDQYLKWKKLAIEQLKKEGYDESYFNEIDMVIGLNVKQGS